MWWLRLSATITVAVTLVVLVCLTVDALDQRWGWVLVWTLSLALMTSELRHDLIELTRRKSDRTRGSV